MPETVYVKVGRRYRPIGMHGVIYEPGVWVVTEKPGERREMCVGPVGDLPDALTTAAVWQHWRTIADAVQRARLQLGLSGSGAAVADVVCRAIAKKEREQHA